MYIKCTNSDSTPMRKGDHMISIDKQSRVPVYEQLVEGFKRDIILGIMEPDSLIPSVRSLSVTLGINPNTVQKAYLELERSNITYSVPGVGRFVSPEGAAILKGDVAKDEDMLREALIHLKQADYTEEQLVDMVRRIYREEGGFGND